MILKVSEILTKRNIFHKIKKKKICTRRSKVKIPHLINNDIAYLVGVIAGDGSLVISKRKRGGFHYRISIYANSEKYLEYLGNLINEYFKIKGRINKDKRKENAYSLIIQNASVFWFFKILEAKYNPTNKIPSFCKDEELFNHYLSGLIDTDGSVGISKKRVQLKLKNNNIVEEIYEKIREANPNPPKINYTNGVPFLYIRFDNIFPLRWKPTAF